MRRRGLLSDDFPTGPPDPSIFPLMDVLEDELLKLLVRQSLSVPGIPA